MNPVTGNSAAILQRKEAIIEQLVVSLSDAISENLSLVTVPGLGSCHADGDPYDIAAADFRERSDCDGTAAATAGRSRLRINADNLICYLNEV